MQSKLMETNVLLSNQKYFINTILFYLATENIVPQATAFEKALPKYTTIDDFLKSFEDFVGTLFEKCFLMSDELKNVLQTICRICQRVVDYVNENLGDKFGFEALLML